MDESIKWHSILTGVAIVTLGAIEIAALVTGHDGEFFHTVVIAVSGLGGLPMVGKSIHVLSGKASPTKSTP